MQVKDIPSEYQLLQNSQDIQAVSDSIGKDLSDYGCLFVRVENGDYTGVIGCYSFTPYLQSIVDQVTP